MKIIYSILNDQGDRSHNDDMLGAVELADDTMLFILADGLGGHKTGHMAAQVVRECVADIFPRNCEEKDCLEELFDEAQSMLRRIQHDSREVLDLKTTLSLLRMSCGTIQWGNVGDTRIYHFFRGRLLSRTDDHSVPQMLCSLGEIAEEDIRIHPDRNKLLRVMGTVWEGKQYDISNPLPMIPGHTFLICTDGFWEYVHENDMVETLNKASDSQSWLEDMEEILLEKSKDKERDNYSAIAVHIV